MRYRFFLIYLFMSIYSSSFAQSAQDIVKQHYPNHQEPGGIAFTMTQGTTQFVPFGKAKLDVNTNITAETAFRMASVSKQFTAMATYLLIKNGRLAFDTPIGDILPELPQATASITLKDLLQHTSGIWDYEEVIPEQQLQQLSDGDVLQLVAPIDSVYFPAGASFRYSNTGYCLLAVIVERVSKMDYPTFVAKHLFAAAGLQQAQVYTSDAVISNRAYGYHPTATEFKFADQSTTSATKGDGGVYISATEFLRWMNNDNPLWNEDFWNTLITQKVLITEGVYYSMGWFMTIDKKGEVQALFHSGESTGFHNAVLFLPQQHIAVGLFTNRDDNLIDAAYDDLLNLYHAKPLKTNRPLFQWLSKVYANEWH